MDAEWRNGFSDMLDPCAIRHLQVPSRFSPSHHHHPTQMYANAPKCTQMHTRDAPKCLGYLIFHSYCVHSLVLFLYRIHSTLSLHLYISASTLLVTLLDLIDLDPFYILTSFIGKQTSAIKSILCIYSTALYHIPLFFIAQATSTSTS